MKKTSGPATKGAFVVGPGVRCEGFPALTADAGGRTENPVSE
jgi:hypothetical protein